MKLRALTLKYFGWCPGMDNAARFIPDGDIPDVKMRKIGAILMAAFSFLTLQHTQFVSYCSNFHYYRGPFRQRVNI